MTRAINLAMPERDVVNLCESNAISISAIETLKSGGTHLVCVTIEGADEARALFRKAIIDGPVLRTAFLRTNPSTYR